MSRVRRGRSPRTATARCAAPRPAARATTSPSSRATWVAAVCDRGMRHYRNEDAVALDARAEPGSRAVLVVCDGVSNSTDSDVASLAAARAARDVLARSSAERDRHSRRPRCGDRQALGAAVDAANDAVISHTVEGQGEPGRRARSWRPCWMARCSSWAGWATAAPTGCRTPASRSCSPSTTPSPPSRSRRASPAGGRDRAAGPRDHPLARRRRPRPHPAHDSLDLASPGWVLVCSDGLWNYCSEPTTWPPWCRRTPTARGRDRSRWLGRWSTGPTSRAGLTTSLWRSRASTDPNS